jgi:hypothetical protein
VGLSSRPVGGARSRGRAWTGRGAGGSGGGGVVARGAASSPTAAERSWDVLTDKGAEAPELPFDVGVFLLALAGVAAAPFSLAACASPRAWTGVAGADDVTRGTGASPLAGVRATPARAAAEGLEGGELEAAAPVLEEAATAEGAEEEDDDVAVEPCVAAAAPEPDDSDEGGRVPHAYFSAFPWPSAAPAGEPDPPAASCCTTPAAPLPCCPDDAEDDAADATERAADPLRLGGGPVLALGDRSEGGGRGGCPGKGAATCGAYIMGIGTPCICICIGIGIGTPCGAALGVMWVGGGGAGPKGWVIWTGRGTIMGPPGDGIPGMGCGAMAIATGDANCIGYMAGPLGDGGGGPGGKGGITGVIPWGIIATGGPSIGAGATTAGPPWDTGEKGMLYATGLAAGPPPPAAAMAPVLLTSSARFSSP